MASSMQGKVAFVTGGGSGIGREVALEFARHGAKVSITDINEQGAKETISQVEKAGSQGVYILADMSKAGDVERAVQETTQRLGRLDYACNNAGIGGPAAQTGEYPVDGWLQVIGINLNGVFFSMRYEIPAMLKSGGGVIVNMASILGLVGWATSPAYVAAKHGVVGLTKTAAIEYATQGIRVNAVCPGFIETPLLEKGGIAPGTDAYKAIAGMHPMDRLGTPDEVAKPVVWLCSEDASFVTGTIFNVDGGFIAK